MNLTAIITAVATEYGVAAGEITGRRQDREIVFPRQIAIWLARKLTHLSYPALGKRFGRSNVTMLYSDRVAAERLYHSSKEWLAVQSICASLRVAVERPGR